MSYDAFIAKTVGGHRGRNGSAQRALDGLPREMGELPDLLAAMPADRLAGAWVALILDAVAFDRNFPLGALARSLIVIAERLHGTRFEVQAMSTPTTTATKPPVTQGDGFAVYEGAPPAPARNGRGFDPLNLQLRSLEPGKFIVIKKDRMKKATIAVRVCTANKERKTGKLHYYTIDSGDMVIVADK